MEVVIGMFTGSALAVTVSYMRVFLGINTIFMVFLAMLTLCAMGILWLVAIPIGVFWYHAPTIDVWRTMVLTNMFFCAIGMVVMSYIFKKMATQIQEEEEKEKEAPIQ